MSELEPAGEEWLDAATWAIIIGGVVTRLFNRERTEDQVGSGVFVMKVEPEFGEANNVPWIRWTLPSKHIVRPRTQLGRNMRVTGITLTVSQDGSVEVLIKRWANRSRHSDWSGTLAFAFTKANGRESTKIKNAAIKIALGRLKHGDAKADLRKVGKLAAGIPFEANVRPVVRIDVDRYN